jgi:arylsulfatase
MLGLCLGIFLISPTASVAQTASSEKKPNIVYFLVDNVGWGSFGVYGGTVPTPNIDKLAASARPITNTCIVSLRFESN